MTSFGKIQTQTGIGARGKRADILRLRYRSAQPIYGVRPMDRIPSSADTPPIDGCIMILAVVLPYGLSVDVRFRGVIRAVKGRMLKRHVDFSWRAAGGCGEPSSGKEKCATVVRFPEGERIVAPAA